MWGGRENESQKGMNFATVAGGGASVNTSGSSSSKFMDSVPPQVSIKLYRVNCKISKHLSFVYAADGMLIISN